MQLRAPGAPPLMTQDADFAQFWVISENIGESLEPPVDRLNPLSKRFAPAGQ